MMATLWTFLCWVHICLVVFHFLIASFGRKLGLRKRYIDLLLELFQFSQQRVDKSKKIRHSISLDDSDIVEEAQKLSFSQPKYLGVSHEDRTGFELGDILDYVTSGVSAIVEDSVLTNFVPKQPPGWNLLTRTNTREYEFISFRLTALWMVGFFIRYFILLPSRLFVLIIGMAFLFVCNIVVGMLPDGPTKRKVNARISIFCFDFVAGSLSLFATFHNPENKPQSGITVANHTSPIDSMILSTDNVYDMVGQLHGGILGYFMTLMSHSSAHIWFERNNDKERSDVTRRLKEHTSDPELPPILIFPEGVCVNNTSVVRFKKGAFEIGCVIYPVAIRFDPRFGDAYWWQDAFFFYILYMMTSWAIVCDVWYLPPVTRGPDETSIEFAKRVKSTIAEQGGMCDVSIDGLLKIKPPKADLKSMYQLEFAKHCSTPKKPQSHSVSQPTVPNFNLIDLRMETISDNNDHLVASNKNSLECSNYLKTDCNLLDLQPGETLCDDVESKPNSSSANPLTCSDEVNDCLEVRSSSFGGLDGDQQVRKRVISSVEELGASCINELNYSKVDDGFINKIRDVVEDQELLHLHDNVERKLSENEVKETGGTFHSNSRIMEAGSLHRDAGGLGVSISGKEIEESDSVLQSNAAVPFTSETEDKRKESSEPDSNDRVKETDQVLK
uniref:Glycerol-3-phosphate acyltransferase 3-like n=1 Tax=Hirondellea gigas TaxID=1518452 RepID=A0A6A7G205_9CRUS